MRPVSLLGCAVFENRNQLTQLPRAPRAFCQKRKSCFYYIYLVIFSKCAHLQGRNKLRLQPLPLMFSPKMFQRSGLTFTEVWARKYCEINAASVKDPSGTLPTVSEPPVSSETLSRTAHELWSPWQHLDNNSAPSSSCFHFSFPFLSWVAQVCPFYACLSMLISFYGLTVIKTHLRAVAAAVRRFDVLHVMSFCSAAVRVFERDGSR